MVLEILTEPDARLHEVCAEAEINDDSKQLLCDMLETMTAHRAYGLAAPQVGKLVRAVVVADFEARKAYGLLNPRIIQRSPHRIRGVEGCLSMPGKLVEITRAWSVTVDGVSINGQRVQIKAKGNHARAWQHELDHLDGKTLARVGQQVA